MRKLLLFCSVIILLVFACQKSADVYLMPSDSLVNTSFTGKVLNEKGEPVSNATITAGNKSAQTDANGVFRINNVNISEQFGYVKAEKAGYFPGSKTVFSNINASNFVEIQLIPRQLKSSFQSGSQTTVDIAPGVNVEFNNTAFVTAAGAIYSGEVKAFASYLDPTADNFESIMPGDLRAIDADSQVVALKSYGMLVVELEGANGQKLQIASGNKAKLNINIPAELLAAAPATIPLWFFDEKDGKWKEEGSAKKIGNTYIGEVSHFTYWNVDVPENFVYASLTLKDQHNNALAYAPVQITNTSDGTYGYRITDSTGYVKMWVPKNARLQVDVLNACKDVLFTKNAGPYNSDADLGEVTVMVNESTSVKIFGTVVKCNNDGVTDGFVNILMEGLYYRGTVSNGKFSLLINRCNNISVTAYIVAGDNNTKKESSPLPVTISNGEYNIGQLSACDNDISEYIQFTINGKNYMLTFPADSLSYFRRGAKTSFSAMTRGELVVNNNVLFIELDTRDTIPHSDTMGYTSAYADDVLYHSESSERTTYTVTKYGSVGDFIEMNFKGQFYRDSFPTPGYPIFGNLRIRRQN